MIYIDRNSIPTPLIFYSEKVTIAKQRLKEFYSRPKDSRQQERYARPFNIEIKNGFINELRQLFKGKCAYCESVISFNSINEYDHFRPKSGARGLDKEFSNEHYWWLVYEWRNIYNVCQLCNRYKSTWFPVKGRRAEPETHYEAFANIEKPLLIDPCNDRPSEHLIFAEDGSVDYLTDKGKVSIEILKLNRSELTKARRESIEELSKTLSIFDNAWQNQEQNWSLIQDMSKDFSSILNQNSSKPFVAAQSQILTKWLDRRSDVKDFFNEELYNYKLETRTFSEKTEVIVSELEPEAKKFINESLKLESIRHVYLDKIELKNFKCFTKLEISFNYPLGTTQKDSEDQSNIEPWLLFLGENGVGKSSVLKAIAIALMGNKYRNTLGDEVSHEKLLKHETTDGYIKLYLKGEKEPIEVTITQNSISSSNDDPISYLVGYGSIRLLPNKKIQPEKGRFSGVKVRNLFDYSIALSDAINWLLKLSNEQFNQAALSLKDLMLLHEEDRLERNLKEQTVYLVRETDPLKIEELSDGYRTVFAVAVDIMSTLSDEKVNYDLAEGIVLIDEIGTHLHPRWKMEVVERLRKCFPKIQFIVTTHEPLCLRGLKSGEVVVLTRNIEKEIIAITDLPDPSELRVDQILTSEFFGLKSTLDSKTEALFDEYYEILARDENKRTIEQKNRLLQLSEIVPKMKHLGDGLREELIYYVIDELLAKKVRTDGLKLREDLKKEAIDRVGNLWNLISADNK